MITSTVLYLGKLRTECTHKRSGQKFITDAPPDNNGRGEAFSPTDLTATSLATCMMTVMGIGAESRGWEINGMQADVTKVMAENPRRISRIMVDLVVDAPELDKENLKILEAIGLSCPVAKSLHPEIRQDVTFSFRALP
ncbi:MAG: OsmC family protein [Bacteroidota bacterium]|nr:OsmC family protein [Bacteroidota bacterium]